LLAPFDAPRLKLERALAHIRETDSAIKSYLEINPCALVVEQFPGPAWLKSHAWTARIRKPVPPTLSTMIGDVVHNLRAALDLLVCDLVRINGKSANKVYFPFCEGQNHLKKAIAKMGLSSRAGTDIAAALNSIAPYKGGNTLLRAIHDLDIFDKHDALLPVIGAMNVPIATIQIGSQAPVQLPVFSTTITSDGQLVMGLPESQIPLGTELPARFFLAFGEIPQVAVCSGRIVVEFLHELAEVANGVVETLSSLRPGATFPPTHSSLRHRHPVERP
jgi:hypothetical protein